MAFTKICGFVILCLLVVSLFNCGTTLPPLTEKQMKIAMVNGNQSTTLELTKSHTIVGSAVLPSEYAARIHADSIDADVAQLLYIDNTKSQSKQTYRFWRKK